MLWDINVGRKTDEHSTTARAQTKELATLNIFIIKDVREYLLIESEFDLKISRAIAIYIPYFFPILLRRKKIAQSLADTETSSLVVSETQPARHKGMPLR